MLKNRSLLIINWGKSTKYVESDDLRHTLFLHEHLVFDKLAASQEFSFVLDDILIKTDLI